MRNVSEAQLIEKIVRNMAHEIRNPLTTLKGYTQLLAQRTDDTEFVRRTVPVLAAQVSRLESILDDLYSAFQKHGSESEQSLQDLCSAAPLPVTLVVNRPENGSVCPDGEMLQIAGLLMRGLDPTVVLSAACRLECGTDFWTLSLAMPARIDRSTAELWYLPYQLKGLFLDGLEPYQAYMRCSLLGCRIRLEWAEEIITFIMES